MNECDKTNCKWYSDHFSDHCVFVSSISLKCMSGGIHSEYVPITNEILNNTEERRIFDTGATRSSSKGKGRFDLLPWTAIWELAKLCETGAEENGEHNVDKGIPLHSLLDSASRHLARYMRGETDENHLVRCMWNIAWAIQFEVDKPELQDIPSRKVE